MGEGEADLYRGLCLGDGTPLRVESRPWETSAVLNSGSVRMVFLSEACTTRVQGLPMSAVHGGARVYDWEVIGSDPSCAR
jgi:hypothetical protein